MTLVLAASLAALLLWCVLGFRAVNGRLGTLETRQHLNFDYLNKQITARTKQPTVNMRKTVQVDYAAGIESDEHWCEDLKKTGGLRQPSK